MRAYARGTDMRKVPMEKKKKKQKKREKKKEKQNKKKTETDTYMADDGVAPPIALAAACVCGVRL